VRIAVPDRPGETLHLTYCTNVHPAPDLAGVHRVVREYAEPVRRRLGVDRLGLGLWLNRAVVDALVAAPSEVERLRAALDDAGLYLFTLNAFPYGDFQAAVVKHAVYRPDWSEHERAGYTMALANLLIRLLPDDLDEASISTLPVGHGREWDDGRTRLATLYLMRVARYLRRLAEDSGKQIRLCLEPEPGCLLETTADAIAFFRGPLQEAAARDGESPAIIDGFLGLCFDCCHQAVAFEDPVASLQSLTEAGVRIGKVQLSAALEVAAPGADGALGELARFVEPRFLHQVRAAGQGGALAAVDDLPEALDAAAAGRFPVSGPWRIHYHVPIHRAGVGGLATTRPELERALAAVVEPGACHHLEVETYTWLTLPEGERPDGRDSLVAAIAAELDWARGRIAGAAPSTAGG
jgi:sugar phosphate isomerase/epimerase